MIVCGSVAIIFKAQPWPEGNRSVPHNGETQRCFPGQEMVPSSGEQMTAGYGSGEQEGEAWPSSLGRQLCDH